MAGAESEERLARRKRIRFLKKLIIFTLVMAIVVPTILCVILGIQLHIVRGQLRQLQAQAELNSQDNIETTVIESMDVPGQAAEDSSVADEEETALYTADGVDVSRRDSSGKEPEEDAGETLPADEDIRRVYLTFDDGPSSNTNRILDILAEYDVKATFFVVGKEEEEYQALYKRIVDEGHTLAMHSYSHKYDEIYQSVDSFAQDLSRLQEFLYETTGVWCRFCRFPGGSSNTVSSVDMNELINYLDEQDITYFDWNVSSGDASSNYISPETILRNCLTTLPQYQESIILMHDASNKNTTVQALPELIEKIQAMDNTVIVPITEDTEPIQHISNERNGGL
ncbi:MAG: polysaccharide deacetylase [Ruminococcus sp.]|nr:polysaccharide deacetylase [Ruminococcus sp.]MCM1155939.1 polysaccharide deacetylase [Roseburia sp.]